MASEARRRRAAPRAGRLEARTGATTVRLGCRPPRARRAWKLLLAAAWLLAVGIQPAEAAGRRVEVARRAAINPGLGSPPARVSRHSPAASWRSFLALAGAGDDAAAAHLLDLTELGQAAQAAAGASVAKALYDVLDLLRARPDAVTSEDADGPKLGGRPLDAVMAMRFERSGIAGEVWLQRTQDLSSGENAWLFSRQTVASAPFWHRVLIERERPRGAEPLDAGLGPLPEEVRRGNPREAVAGFLDACGRGRFDLAAFYLDLGALTSEEQRERGPRLARRLYLALLRSVWIDPEKVSNDPFGAAEVDVPESEQLLAVVDVHRQRVEILLSHLWDAELGHVWTFSRNTVASIDRLYEAHGYGWLGDHIPVVFFAVSPGGLQLWQWIALALALLAGWPVSHGAARLVLAGLGRVSRAGAVSWNGVLAASLDGPLAFGLWAAVLSLASPWFGLSPEVQRIARTLCSLLALIALGWFLLRLVDRTVERMGEAAGERNAVALGFLPIFRRFAKTFVVVLVVLGALDTVGVKLLAVLAGLGLGGVAVALGAQKTLENLFGTLAIAGDRPFKVGDTVTIGTDTGTVEDVGLRSTRLRTAGRSLVTIPNGQVVAERIENLSARERLLFNPILGVVYGTSADQLAYILDEIKRLLLGHPRVGRDGLRVRLQDLAASALEIEVACWIETRQFHEYTRVVEELNFGFLRIVEQAGTSFAFPSQTLYLARGSGIDAARAAEAALEVARRRERGELCVPEVPEAVARKLRDEGGSRAKP